MKMLGLWRYEVQNLRESFILDTRANKQLLNAPRAIQFTVRLEKL